MPRAAAFLDTPDRYGIVSRVFHWAAAYLLVWQFVTLVGWRLIGDGALMRGVSKAGPYHGTVGVLVVALVLPRALWALRNNRRRPARGAGVAGRLAQSVHAAFYALMFAVPALALLRAYGNGKGYELWGFPLVPQTGREVAWLILPADLLHAPLAWGLGVLIAGHVAMALAHRFRRRDDVLARMAGPLRSPARAAR